MMTRTSDHFMYTADWTKEFRVQYPYKVFCNANGNSEFAAWLKNVNMNDWYYTFTLEDEIQPTNCIYTFWFKNEADALWARLGM